MCLWCEVETRVYRSYEARERKALEEIGTIQKECPAAEASGAEDCPDRPRCVWEKKLEYVIARMQRERLAVEMSGADRCGVPTPGEPSPDARKLPALGVAPHLLTAFERYIEILFDRLAAQRKPAPSSRRRTRKLVPFTPPVDRAR
jgi:hypothetical protein